MKMNVFYQIDYIDEHNIAHYCDTVRDRYNAERKCYYLNKINERINPKTKFVCNIYHLIRYDITGANEPSEYAKQQERYEQAYYKRSA